MTVPVILLHGWGLSAKTFSPLKRLLRSKGYSVFAPDLPGFGNAIIPKKPLGLTDYVEFLHAYCKNHHFSKVVIIGHSFGGRVALRFSLTYPKLVAGLILTGTPGYSSVSKRRLALLIGVAKVGKLFFFIPLVRLLRDHVRRWYYYVVGARDYYRAQGVMQDTFKNIVKEELVTSMKAVRAPTFLVWGANDIIVPTKTAQKMKETMANVKLAIIPGADHGLPYKKPEQFLDTIYDFLLSLTKHAGR